MSFTPDRAAEQLPLAPLSFTERKAYAELATTHADERGLMQISANTVLRLLAQAGTVELLRRREKGLSELVAAWTTTDSPDDYHDAATEIRAILEDPNYGDPAYQEPEAEHDGQGWRVPYPPLNRPDHAV